MRTKESLLERKAAIVGLSSIDGIGARTIVKILNWCQKNQLSLNDFWFNKNHVWREISLSERIVESIKSFRKEHDLLDNLKQLQSSGIQVLTFEENFYPKLLLATEDFPAVLFVKSRILVGSVEWQTAFAQTISVVGTRKITNYGHLVIQTLLPPLVAARKIIVSGFMYGVDLEAAKLALASGGQTIAVLGFGFDHCFPVSQKKIMSDFFDRGVIFLSEFPPTTFAKAANFVIRNRIVAGLSKATLVIEAAKRSGSHITASYANDYGRLVMAVPGPITNPFSAGTKALISQGAVLVNSATDILVEIEDDYHLTSIDSAQIEVKGDSKLNLLLESLSFYPEMSLEDLQKRTKLTSTELNQFLFDLELQGKIIKKWGKYCLVS